MSKSFFSSSRKSADKRDRQNQMSIEKPFKTTSTQGVKELSLPNGLQQVNSNVISQRIHGLVKQQVVGADPSTILSVNVFTQLLGKNIRQRFMTFRQVDYIVPGWVGTGFPNVIYLSHKGSTQYGYNSPKGEPSSKIAALELTEISPLYDDSSVKTYDLRYSLRDVVTWGIWPSTIDKVEFQVFVDDETEPLELPLPNPITVNLEIRYELM